MRVLVVNAGSSSLKLRVLGAADEVLAEAELGATTAGDDESELAAFLEGVDAVDAVGHRVVHGGPDLVEPTLVDGDVEDRIEALTPLAPLHQPRALAGIRAVRRLLPEAPTVACFDTAFHATLAPSAATYALPAAWRERWGLRRYGFHGLSHAYAVRRAAELIGRASEGLRVICCHLGAGASLCAAVDGRSVDTTMGFTPVEGLVMATRSGSVDPGLVVWLIERAGLAADEVSRCLEQGSGLAALSGGTGDMRDVLADAGRGHDRAELAFAVYIHRLAREVAAMAAATGGIDALVFTGGVGEHQPPVRAAAGERLAFLGIALDAARNDEARSDADISAAGAGVRTLVVTAREDVEIAAQVRRLLA